ncbi:MAG: RNA 2',3'-cyclic phosphodiesterase [Chlorobi bacterium]|nr:RNA 2',3'-cyclic phosphodiesterase [Chlorobiota bacterium]
MKRVFIGYDCNTLPELVSLSSKLKETLKCGNIRWIPPENWHITSHFIGNAGDNEIEILKEILFEASSGTGPFSVTVKGIGFFPSARRPKVMWSGVSPVNVLSKLHYRTGALLRREGFETDNRPYNPHITIARIKHCEHPEKTENTESTYRKAVLGYLNIDRIILYESILFPDGAKYIPLKEYSLL